MARQPFFGAHAPSVSMIFAGMPGAAVADTAGLGLIEIRDMVKEGYSRHFAVDQGIIYDERGDPARIEAMPTVNAALRETFDKLRDEGKVGYLATFPHTPAFAEASVDSGVFDGMVAFFNLAETEMVPFLDAMRERGMGYVTMRPYCQGLLTDKWQDPSTLPAGDSRLGPDLAHVRDRFQRLQAELGAEVESWTSLAAEFALADPLFPSVILGMNTVEQVETAIAAADGDYPDPAFIQRGHGINTTRQ